MDLSLLTIAGLGLVAIVVGHLFKRFVPEIVVFLVLGLAIGPEGLNLINEDNVGSLNLLTQVALGAVIFLIGDRLRLDDLVAQRGRLLPINLAQMLAAGLATFLAVRWAGVDGPTAILLALIATETGVLTVTATINEQRAKGPTTDLLLSSVGLTNVATAVVFGISLPFVLATTGAASPTDTLLVFGELIVLSTLIGLVGGWILKTFATVIETGGELLLFLLVILVGMVGAAVALDGSVVVTTLIAGLYVANAAPWLADRLFATVRTLEAPIYLIFFVVAGAGIHLDELTEVGLIGVAYVVARGLGKVLGATLGGLLARDHQAGFRMGLGLLPHAGMAIALVALVVEQAPQFGPTVSGVVLASIVVFELGGPLLARQAIRSAGEAGAGAGQGSAVEAMPEVLAQRSFTRVLVPVGSVSIVMPRLPFLLDLVGTMRAELVVVHISRPGTIDPDSEPEVLRLVARVAEERNISVQTVHRISDEVARTLVDVVAEHDVELVVMGEPARTSLLEPSRWGTISQRVIRDVEIPVLVYPVDPSDPDRVPSVYLRRALQAEASDRAQAEDLADAAEPDPVDDRASTADVGTRARSGTAPEIADSGVGVDRARTDRPG